MHTGGPAPETVSVAAWAEDALVQLADLPGVRRAGLALAEGGGRRLRFTASDRDRSSQLDWCDVDAYDDVPLNVAVRTGRLVVGPLHELAARFAEFVERQEGTTTVAVAAVPIVAPDRTLGAFLLFFDRPQPFDSWRRLELERFGRELGDGLRRAQRGEERRSDLAPSDDPVPPGALVAVHDVRADPAAVGEARRFLRHTLGEWGVDEDTTDTAVLCLSELVTNAVIHSHAGCRVRVLLGDGVLTTAVHDFGTSDAAAAEPLDDPLQVHGRGLQLVDALAARWDYELDPAGTTVWFSLDL